MAHKRTCACKLPSKLCDDCPLPLPLHRQFASHVLELEKRRLAAIDNRLDEVGSEQVQTEHPADIGAVELFCLRKFVERCVSAGLQKLTPAKCAGERLDERVVGTALRRPAFRMIWHDNEFSSAALSKGERNGDSERL